MKREKKWKKKFFIFFFSAADFSAVRSPMADFLY